MTGNEGSGSRVLGAPAALSSIPGKSYARVALSVGLDADASAQQILEHLAAATLREPIAPVVVESGPVQQNVLLGEEASLAGFAKLTLHEGDGGPYVNTWGTIIARTPDGAFTSWSIARIMAMDDRHLTGLVAPGQHIHYVWSQWEAIGQPMPFALVQGGHPAIPFVSGMPLPNGVEEVGYLGALLGRPVELVRAQTNDLLVPANAEIVIEGRLAITRDAMEGPMGEYAGYQPKESSAQPIYTIDAITYRDDPIWPAVAEGEPVDEYHTVTGITGSADVLGALRAAGLPVAAVWAPPEMAMHALVITVHTDWRESLPGVTSEELSHRIFDVGRDPRPARAQQRQQPRGQREVPQMVCAPLQFEAVLGDLPRRRVHHAGVVDQQVDRPAFGEQLPGEVGHRLQRRQVELPGADAGTGCRGDDPRDGVVALGGVAHGQDHLRAGRRQPAG